MFSRLFDNFLFPGELSHFSQWLLQTLLFLKMLTILLLPNHPETHGHLLQRENTKMPLEGNYHNFLAPDLQICLLSHSFLLPAEDVSLHKYKIHPSIQPCQWSVPCLCPKLYHTLPQSCSSNGPFISKPGLWKLFFTLSSPIMKSSGLHILNLSWIYPVIQVLCYHHP